MYIYYSEVKTHPSTKYVLGFTLQILGRILEHLLWVYRWQQARCPMPLASLLRDRFVASQNAGRGS